jgi:HK97 family phage portal protein
LGIISNLKYRFKNLSAEEISKELDDPILRALVGGETITREKAMAIPSVSSNVDLISSMIASMPIKLYRDKGTKVEEVKDDYRLALLNDDTKDLLDAFQWKKALVTDYLMGKGGYSYVKWTRNVITGLYYVECNKVTPFKNIDPIHKKCSFVINSIPYKDWEILRLLRNTSDGITGVSITSEISKELETAFSTMLYQLNLVKKGGNKKGFLTTNRKLTQDAIDNLKTAWKNMYLTNEENCVVLNEGMDFKESSNSSVEMQLDQSKNTLDKQIDKVFHIEADFNNTFKCAILPIIKSLESALNRYLLLEKEKKAGYFFECDIKEITKANLKERYEAYQIALNSGWRSRNEIRYEENLDQIEGLDTYNVTLGAVLFDPKTQTYFVPNTSQIQEIDENTQKDAKKEPKSDEKEPKLEKSEPKGDENTQESEQEKKGGDEDE